nr:putative ribonuclease H-like domain-containing protein [Tanacetum cinerariifolium]
ARTLLADSLLPIPFWAEAVNTACYVQNRVLVTKPHYKTPYELLHGRLPSFQDTEKAGEEGTQTYVLFLMLSDESTNPKNNNKDAHADGKEHDDDIQKFVSPDIQFSSCGDQIREQEFEECINNTSNGVGAAGLDFTNSTNDFSAACPSVSAAELNFTNITNNFSAAGPSNMPNLLDLSHNADDVGADADINNMDSIITFLYGTIEEEVYVCQPPGFKDPEYPDKVYKVVKALYGLHQAPRAWYETLANYLMENGFQRGTIDQTLFIKKQQKDILLVQIYVDDVIFGATNKAPCQSFEKLMKDKFQMSSIGELTFFLGL